VFTTVIARIDIHTCQAYKGLRPAYMSSIAEVSLHTYLCCQFIRKAVISDELWAKSPPQSFILKVWNQHPICKVSAEAAPPPCIKIKRIMVASNN
jgi:hypothetical protein